MFSLSDHYVTRIIVQLVEFANACEQALDIYSSAYEILVIFWLEAEIPQHETFYF